MVKMYQTVSHPVNAAIMYDGVKVTAAERGFYPVFVFISLP